MMAVLLGLAWQWTESTSEKALAVQLDHDVDLLRQIHETATREKMLRLESLSREPRYRALAEVRDEDTLRQAAQEVQEQVDCMLFAFLSPSGEILGSSGEGANELVQLLKPDLPGNSMHVTTNVLLPDREVVQALVVPLSTGDRVLGYMLATYALDTQVLGKYASSVRTHVALREHDQLLAASGDPFGDVKVDTRDLPLDASMYLRITRRESDVAAPLVEAYRILILIALGCTLLGSIAAMGLARWFSGPMRQLADAARAIGSGNHDIRAQETGAPELIEVARSFNAMIESLEGYQDQLVQQHEFIDNVLKSMLDPLIVLNSKREIITANPEACRLLEYEGSELLGRNLSDILAEENDLSSSDLGRMAEEGDVREIDLKWRTQSGETIPVAASLSLAEETGEGPGNLVVVVRDMRTIQGMLETEKKLGDEAAEARESAEARALEAEDALGELKVAQEELLHTGKMAAIGALAGGVAHDFNNELTAIIGYSDLLLLGIEDNEELRDYVQEIGHAGERAAQLTQQLLAVGRKQMLAPRVVDLNAVVGELVKLLRRVIGETIELKLVSGAGLWRVKIDTGQIEQVILNLALNARDAMPDGGSLRIETQNVVLDETNIHLGTKVEPGEYVQLAVADTGTGMDKVTLKRIFEPFFTTKEVGKGTGLGLATVYGIVHQSNGYVSAYSEVGQGSVFRIYLPRVSAPLAPPRDARTPRSLPRGTETILLAEDEEAVRNLLRTVLSKQGYQVIEAQNGREALALIEGIEATIPLLVTDVVMPEMGGGELAQELTKLNPEVRVIYLSGHMEDASLVEDLDQHTRCYLHKPVPATVLLEKIREMLDSTEG
jgi:PAS domain S-box-containing protein